LMFFKYVSTTKYADKIPEILKMIQDEFKKETGMKNLEALLIYLYSTQDREISEVIEVIKPILPEKEGILMTTAEMLRKEGREEGREEGIRKGRTDGIYQALVSTVNTRFQKVPEDITIELKTIQSQEKMMELLQQAVLCGDVGEYRQIVQQVIRG
jgi:flagellar biosynthesis/type III secretory pathway protein FliH